MNFYHMYSIIKIYLVLILFAGIQSVNAQEGSFSPMPLNGSNAVDVNTGTPVFNLPLWTLEGRTLKVPISATYAAKGFGVNQSPGLIGTSWELLAGGFIAQQTMGNDDFSENGFKNEGYKVLSTDTTYLGNVNRNLIDAEPDIFLYNLPSGSGKFVFNNYGQIMTINKSNYKISFNADSSFTIVDDYGTKYYFGIRETTRFYVQKADSFVHLNNSYKWMLSSMISANNSDTITFEYKDSYYTSGIIQSYNCLKSISNNYIKSETYSSYKYNILKKSLFRINAATGSIKFNYLFEPESTSYTSTLKREFDYGDIILPQTFDQDSITTNAINTVKSIEIYNVSDVPIKTYLFQYVYPANRVLLSEITEKSQFEESTHPFRFYYLANFKVPPIFASFRSDFGGFPMASYNPAQYVRNNLEYYFLKPDNYSQAGLLYEVYFPKGSFLHFDYEKNTYSMPESTPWFDSRWASICGDTMDIPASGLRVKSILEGDGKSNKRTDFEYLSEDGFSSGRMTDYPINYYPFTVWALDLSTNCNLINTNLMNLFAPEVYYERITIYHGGKILGTDKGVNGKTVNEFFVEPSTRNQNSTFIFPLLVSIDKDHSVLKSKKIYDQFNEIQTVTEYTYTMNNSGQFSRGLKVVATDNKWKPTYSHENYILYQKTNRIDAIKYLSIDDNQNKDSTIVNYIYTRGTETSLYPLTILTRNGLNDTLKKELYYPTNTNPDPILKSMAINYNIKALPIKEEHYKNGLLLSGSLTKYDFFTSKNLLMPKSFSTIENGNYIERTFFDIYDEQGILLQKHDFDQVYTSYIFAYKNTLKIAEIINAKISQVFYTSFEDNENAISGISKTGEKYHPGPFTFSLPSESGQYLVSYYLKNGDLWEYQEEVTQNAGGNYSISAGPIDELRVHPLEAFMITQTWKPGIGVSSNCDQNGVTSYQNFDDFGRPIEQLNQDFKKVMDMKYHSLFQNTNYSYTISGTGELPIGCHALLSTQIDGTDGTETIDWEWFDDFCNGNKIAISSQLDIILQSNPQGIYSVDDTCKTYYVRPVINGNCLPCKEHLVRFKIPVFLGPLKYYYTYNEQTVFIPVSFSDCSTNWELLNPGQFEWGTISKEGSSVRIDLLTNTRNSQRIISVRLKTENSALETVLYVYQGSKPTLQFESTVQEGSAMLVAKVSGGAAPYTYKWVVNGHLNPTNSNTLSLPLGSSYLIACEVTDSYTSNQTVTSNLTYSTANLLHLEMLEVVLGESSMRVTASGGTPPYTYSWYKNGVLIVNATKNYFNYPNGSSVCCKVTDSSTTIKQYQWICNLPEPEH